MKQAHPLKLMIESRKTGRKSGMYSACTANAFVLGACMKRAHETGGPLLIEATANQVNQYGGYTGMRPADFAEYVHHLAGEAGLPAGRIILGGDHLGPLVWKNEPPDAAMRKAAEMIRQYVLAGYTKIHIDASMKLAGDDPETRLTEQVIADRTAVLCRAAEEAWADPGRADSGFDTLVYVIGSEVPLPGGSQADDDMLRISLPDDFERAFAAFRRSFHRHGLRAAFQNVVAMVVQPGVEFGDGVIHGYSRDAAQPLCNALKKYPDLVFEGHSTDYQTPVALRQMVEDGIAILKVGPALTFALREALFALENMEKAILDGRTGMSPSGFADVLEGAMLANPAHWTHHYRGDQQALRFARKYSFSDRTRYYLPLPEVQAALSRLIANLDAAGIPLPLISQHMPVQFRKIRDGQLDDKPLALLQDHVVHVIDDYLSAVMPGF